EPVRTFSKLLHRSLLQDLNKCLLLNENEIKPLPAEIRTFIPEEDIYLIEIYSSVNADLFVTTDEVLLNALKNNTDINVKSRDEFLSEYL
ncbi:MAG: hypothetical protein AB1546_04135, partial [bacterium]